MTFTELNKRLKEVDDLDELTDEEREAVEAIVRVTSIWITENVKPALENFVHNLIKALTPVTQQLREDDNSEEFSQLFKLTNGDYMTEKDLEIKAREYEEQAEYYEEDEAD